MIESIALMGLGLLGATTAVASGALRCPASARSQLTGSAPMILRDLASAWRRDFARNDPALSLTLVEPFGPPQGSLNPSLERFLEGRADFSFLTREISEADLATFRRSYGADPVVVPVARGAWDKFGYVDAVAIIVNDANPVRRLTLRQIDTAFSSSRLRGGSGDDWGALGVSQWRGRPVHIAGGGAWSGEESARALTIRRHVLSAGGRRGIWRPAPRSGNEADVVARVAADPLAVGYTGVGHIGPGVHAVAVALTDGSAAYLPTAITIASGRYPLARTVDLFLPPKAVCRPRGSVDFARYVLSPAGQNVVRTLGPFLPLTTRQLRRSALLLAR
ncbi:MAG: substrate-binding domain-containing protein [Sphingomonas sp.]